MICQIYSFSDTSSKALSFSLKLSENLQKVWNTVFQIITARVPRGLPAIYFIYNIQLLSYIFPPDLAGCRTQYF